MTTDHVVYVTRWFVNCDGVERTMGPTLFGDLSRLPMPHRPVSVGFALLRRWA